MFFRKYDKFDIRIGKPVKVQTDPSPDDPLDEFTEVEMGLKWFCRDYNHYIVIEIAELKIDDLDLYPDVLSILEDGLVKYVAEPTIKKDRYNYIREDVTLILTHKNDKMVCQLRDQTYKVKYSNCIKKLRSFVDGIFNTAIKKGYFKAEDANQVFGWKPQSSITFEMEKFSGKSLFDEDYE